MGRYQYEINGRSINTSLHCNNNVCAASIFGDATVYIGNNSGNGGVFPTFAFKPNFVLGCSANYYIPTNYHLYDNASCRDSGRFNYVCDNAISNNSCVDRLVIVRTYGLSMTGEGYGSYSDIKPAMGVTHHCTFILPKGCTVTYPTTCVGKYLGTYTCDGETIDYIYTPYTVVIGTTFESYALPAYVTCAYCCNPNSDYSNSKTIGSTGSESADIPVYRRGTLPWDISYGINDYVDTGSGTTKMQFPQCFKALVSSGSGLNKYIEYSSCNTFDSEDDYIYDDFCDGNVTMLIKGTHAINAGGSSNNNPMSCLFRMLMCCACQTSQGYCRKYAPLLYCEACCQGRWTYPHDYGVCTFSIPTCCNWYFSPQETILNRLDCGIACVNSFRTQYNINVCRTFYNNSTMCYNLACPLAIICMPMDVFYPKVGDDHKTYFAINTHC